MPNTRISDLTAAVSVSGTDVYPSVQTAGIGPVKTSLDQIKTYTLGGTGTLPVANGGTGLTSLTAGRIPFGAGTSAFGNSANLFWDSVNSQLAIGAGSASLPALSTVGDTNTGLFFPSANIIAIATDGSERFRIDASGNAALGGSTQAASRLFLTALFNGDGGGYARMTFTDATFGSTVTNTAIGYGTNLYTQAASFTVGTLSHFDATLGGLGATSGITNQYGFRANSSLTGATNNYGFFSNIASATGRYNFYANGTAPNLFSGNVLIFGAGALGYASGSGGAVTQTTSRTTGVTLNKTNGAITLVSAAGSATATTFTVTNSTVAATDVVTICQKSGTDTYVVAITQVAAGSFNVTFYTTGGTTTEQPVFNFAVLKAVTV